MPFVDGSATLQMSLGLGGGGALNHAASANIELAALVRGPIHASPRVASAVAISPGVVRVTFDQQMTNDSRLTSPGCYTLSSLGAGAAIFVSSITPEQGVTYPRYVDIRTTEHTNAQSYRVTVLSGASGPRSRYAMSMNTAGLQANFTGQGVAPQIARVAAVGQNRVDVVFDEVMDDNAALRDVSRYVFDGGLTVLSILEVAGDTVRLVTSDQTPGQLYNLTIN